MAKSTTQLTEAEWVIIRAVWEHQPCAAPTVQEALQKEKKWSYSTVKTLMDRMAAKGTLRAERVRNLVLYRAGVTQVQAKKNEVVRTLKRAFDGAMTPMMQFLVESGSLSEKELGQLEEMVKQKRRDKN